jgi:Ca2+-binding RTX toxin-like protein
MAFTFTVSGSSPNLSMSITSQTSVNLKVVGGLITLDQGSGTVQSTGYAPSQFAVGGIPVQTIWSNAPAATVVVYSDAYNAVGFADKFAAGSIITVVSEVNSQGDLDNLLTLSSLNTMADGALRGLSMNPSQFAGISSLVQPTLDAKLADAPAYMATIAAESGTTTGVVVDAFNYDSSFAILGSSTADQLSGGAGNDSINGSSGNDLISGLAGNDTLIGGSNDDTLTGGAGNDVFSVDFNTDTVTDLGDGQDALIVGSSAQANVTVVSDWTATAATQNTSGAATLSLDSGVDVNLIGVTGGDAGFTVTASDNTQGSFIRGSKFADTITGSSLDDQLRGAAGNDTINAGAGDDLIFGGSGDDSLSGGDGADLFVVDLNTDTITDLGLGADELIVSRFAQANATVVSDWTATADTSNSGTVSLTLDSGADVNLAASGGTSGYTVSASDNTVAAFVRGSANNDIIEGSSLGDELRGAAGNDSINGGVGNDVIFGGAGNDTITGGSNIDTITVDFGTDTITDLAVNGDQDILIVTSGAQANATVVSDWTATAASSNTGTVSLTLGSQVDVDLSAATGTNGYTVAMAAGASGLAATITGSSYADNITGGSGADTIFAGAGNDTILGGSGADTINGGAGDDVITGGSNDDSLIGGAGADTFNVDANTDTITDLGLGQDILVVSANAQANATVVSDWTASAASSNSGVASLDLNSGINVDLSGITTGSGYIVSADQNTAASYIRGSIAADTITGSSLADELRGAAGNDTISAGAGNDIIFGGAGNDSLNGGLGADTFNVDIGTDTIADLGQGQDILVVTSGASAGATVVTDWTATADTSNNGSVTLTLDAGIDIDLTDAIGTTGYTIGLLSAGTTAASDITGSDFADIITGSSGNDILDGGAGADIINGGAGTGADIIIGGFGADTLTGGSGADTFGYDLGDTGITLVTSDSITDFLSATDKISVGLGSFSSSDVSVVAGTSFTSYSQFTDGANTAFSAGGGGYDVYVATDVQNAAIGSSSGGSLVAIDSNRSGSLDEGDVVIRLIGTTTVVATDFVS